MNRWIRGARHRKRYSKRRAGAIVEFAVVLPLLITILFGIIEYGWIFMIRQTLQHAAREGCRLAVLQTTADADITTLVAGIMGSANVSTYGLALTHADSTNDTETVVVSVAHSDVSLVGNFFGTADYTLIGSCSMRKEGWTAGGP